MTVAYIYARYSLKIQGMGDSLRRQIKKAEDYIVQMHWTLGETVTDLGVSAYNGKNLKGGGLGLFLAEIESGKIATGSALVVEALDRLSRDTITEQLVLLLRIIQAGITLVTMIDGRTFTTQIINANPFELIISLAVMLRGHEESDLKSDRISTAWAEKRQNIGTVKMTKKCPPWLELNANRTDFVRDNSRVSIIKDMFRWALAGLSPQMIIDQLEIQERKSWGKSGQWTLTQILDVLKSRAVIGEFQPHKMVDGRRVPVGELQPAYFPKIINQSAFANVQRILKFTEGTRQGDANLFIGLAWDGQTGERVVKRNDYLTNESCDRGGLTHRWAYRAFEQNLLNYLQDFDWLSLLIEPGDQDEETEVDRLMNQIEDTEVQLERAVQQVLAGKSCSDSHADDIARLEGDLNLLKTKLVVVERLGSGISPAKDKDVVDAKARIIQLVTSGHMPSRLRLRLALRLVIERIDLFPTPQFMSELKTFYPAQREAVGLKTANDPTEWPHYKITFVNGTFVWVICERANLKSEDLRTQLCKNNAGIICQFWLKTGH